MAWMVTSWRTDRLAALLDAEAREAARTIVGAAERDARRAARSAARETADAGAYLDELERLGVTTLAAVRAQRDALQRTNGAPDEIRVRRGREHDAGRPPRPRRASLHDTPLGELFRSTAVR